MTFLVAWRESEQGIVVAADAYLTLKRGIGSDSYLVWGGTVDKFRRVAVPGTSLAYGFLGASQRGELFGTILGNQIREVASWDDLYIKAATWMGNINRTPPQSSLDTLSVVLAGWVDGDQQLLQLAPDGTQEAVEVDLRMAGPGAINVQTSWLIAPEQTPDTMRAILDDHFDAALMLRGPARLWRLTPDTLDPL